MLKAVDIVKTGHVATNDVVPQIERNGRNRKVDQPLVEKRLVQLEVYVASV